MNYSYGQMFTKTIIDIDNKYRPFHNLFLLKSLNQKSKCFESFSK